MFDEVDDIPWLQQGDQLFIAGEYWWHNACLNYMPDDWHLYTIGYKQAADALVENCAMTHRHLDSLVFPIVFLYKIEAIHAYDIFNDPGAAK